MWETIINAGKKVIRVHLSLNLLYFHKRHNSEETSCKRNGINSESWQYDVCQLHATNKKKIIIRKEQYETWTRTMRGRSNETFKTRSELADIVNNNDMELIWAGGTFVLRLCTRHVFHPGTDQIAILSVVSMWRRTTWLNCISAATRDLE